MKIINIMLMTAVATATLTGCCSKSNEAETAAEYVDDVKVALADSGRIDQRNHHSLPYSPT